MNLKSLINTINFIAFYMKSIGDPTYGIPLYEKTRKRGLEANKHIGNEIVELCQVNFSNLKRNYFHFLFIK